MKILILILIVFALVTNNDAIAQLDIDLNTTNGYVTNQMQDASLLSTAISSNNLSLNYQPESPFSVIAGLGYVNYLQLSDRNYLTLYSGLGYSSYLNADENASISILLVGNIRSASEDNSLSDSKQLLGGLQIKKLFTETSVIDISNNLRYKRYDYLSELSFLDNQLAASFTKSFETKTTLNLALTLNTKLYSDNISLIAIDGPGANPANLNKSTVQLVYQIALAQNLFEKTGIRLSYEQSTFVKDYETPLDYVGYDFSGDGEFFDDPYSFEQSQVSLTLTQMLPYDVKFSAVGSYAQKTYNYMSLIAEDTYQDRLDDHYSYQFGLEKSFSFDSSFFKRVNLKMDYEFYDNKSTMSETNYSGDYFLFGIEIGL